MALLSALVYLLLAYLSIPTVTSPIQTNRSLNSSNNLITPPTLEAPPNPFIYFYDSSHEVVFERKSIGHIHDNPGTTIHNVKYALQDAGRRILAIQEREHVKGNARFPLDRFIYNEPLVRSAHRPPFVRHFRLEIRGVHSILHLSYDAVKIIMLGLIDYTNGWDHGHAGSDRVNMCNFTMYWLPFAGQTIAVGSINLIVPNPPIEIVATS